MDKRVAFITIMIAVSVLGFIFPFTAHANSSSAGPKLTAEWWQWAFSIPNTPASEDGGSVHPLVGDNDDFGDPDFFEFCGNGQHGEVWFLGGDFSGSGETFERTCEIPAHKTILLPVINFECSTAEGDATQGASAEQQAQELKKCAKPVGDLLGGTAWFGPENGPLKEVKVRRIRTEDAFLVHFAPSNVIGLEDPYPNPSLAQADGQWVILRNLRPGRYRLEFTGVFDDPETPEIDFEINGAYNLVVSEENGELPSE